MILIEIQLIDEDPFVDDLLGTQKFKLSDLCIGNIVEETFKFDDDQVL